MKKELHEMSRRNEAEPKTSQNVRLAILQNLAEVYTQPLMTMAFSPPPDLVFPDLST